MNPSKSKALLSSLLLSYLLSGLLLLLLSFALYRWNLKEDAIGIAVYLVYAVSCLSGGLLAGKRLRSRRFFWGTVNGALYFLILFLASTLAGHGLPVEMERLSIALVCCLVCGMAGGMIS